VWITWQQASAYAAWKGRALPTEAQFLHAAQKKAQQTTPDPLHPGAILYNSSDPDGLNDCEKILLANATGVNNPDSNGDSIPDYLEFKNFIPFQTGTTPAVNSPESDGYSIYEKIKYSLPTSVSVSYIPNILPSQYTMTQSVNPAGQLCYGINVTQLPIATPQDKIRVDVSFTSNLANSSPLYKVGYKNFSPGSSSLIFNDWTDATEVANKTWSQWP